MGPNERNKQGYNSPIGHNSDILGKTNIENITRGNKGRVAGNNRERRDVEKVEVVRVIAVQGAGTGRFCRV